MVVVVLGRALVVVAQLTSGHTSSGQMGHPVVVVLGVVVAQLTSGHSSSGQMISSHTVLGHDVVGEAVVVLGQGFLGSQHDPSHEEKTFSAVTKDKLPTLFLHAKTCGTPSNVFFW
jgi:hypothetical protein